METVSKVTVEVFKTPDNLEQNKYKPRIINWLVNKFGLPPYAHSFKDNWVSVNIWNGSLSISFDSRVPEQQALFNSIPKSYKGCPQYGTGIMVNLHNLYFYFSQEWQIEYPKVVRSKIINKDMHRDNDGDDFYTYDHLVNLSDATQILYHNQSERMDICDMILRTKIQERFFYNLVMAQK